ncbi:energy transducer TonB [Chryseobacterium sp. PBS4-4]|uniref:Energy transducer TonB n=1 Tax=Chryseobacterium edaphi TaxID=2976532 RepID=A0ABT2W5S0_9FLAO|nr:energy transducer TonB [Chryseobacterium edaphi]MCU7617355.1 energy transducer TonB [Chryseobacterium edaphi]
MKKYLVVLLLLFLGFKGFSQETKAEYEGGNAVFANKFMEMLYAYVDVQSYAIEGTVTYIINIDKTGKASHLDIIPKIKNGDMFVDDSQYALKKVKGKWKPATKDGIAVSSKYIMKVNFKSNTYDHD